MFVYHLLVEGRVKDTITIVGKADRANAGKDERRNGKVGGILEANATKRAAGR
jgi:hypothetical protein